MIFILILIENQGHFCCSIDLSAVFDTIDQNTLKSRLDFNFGISGCALQWLRLSSYLSDRSQFVSVGGRRSKTMVCKFGVPQGSVLGPLLFLLYASPIVNVISGFGIGLSVCWWHSALYFTEKWESSLSLLSDCFVAVHWWLTLNGLSLNLDKSEVFIIGIGAQQRIEGSIEVIDLGNVHIQHVGKCSQSWCRDW